MAPLEQWLGKMILLGDFPSEHGKLLKFWGQQGWGRLTDAVLFTYVPADLPHGAATMELVPVDAPFKGRWGFNFATRADMMRIADFEGVEEDEFGNPKVLLLEFHCISCDSTWPRSVATHNRIRCPQCGAAAAPCDGIWSGPNHKAIMDLWERLPPSNE